MVSDGEKEHIVISDTVLPVGVFTHIAVTVDGSKIRIIINGQLDFEAQQEVSVAEGDFPLAIGRLNRLNFFNEVIDEVRIYNRALSTNEIKAIYDAGSAGMIMSKTIFADEVFLINDPNNTPDEGPPSSMFGPPDGRYVDMDGGGTTFGFPDEAVDFDWGVVIPVGTQLIVVTLDGANNVFGEVTWGYGTPIDNGDGIASNATGTTKLLETTTISPHPWSGEFPAKFLFYAFDGDFDGVSKEFFVSLDDLADTEIDAVAIYDAGSAGMINP